jgi:hypothetical protein
MQQLPEALRSMRLNMLIVIILRSIHDSLDFFNRDLRLPIISIQPINLLLDITPKRAS